LTRRWEGSVAALFQLWPLLTASKVKVVKCTREARATLDRTTLEGLLSPSAWRELGFFASVKPPGRHPAGSISL